MLPRLLIALPLLAQAQSPAILTITNTWEVLVTLPGAKPQTLQIPPPQLTTITAEKYEIVPLFNPKASGWSKGARLNAVKAQETTSPGILKQVILRAGPTASSETFTPGTDYDIDIFWGTFGRLPNGKIKPDQPVYATYTHALLRLDAVVQSNTAQITLRPGEPRTSAPVQPKIAPNERHLGNIYIRGAIAKLEIEHLFPVLETAYPELQPTPNPTIDRIKQRLATNKPFKILAWGDSVTDGTYLTDRSTQRWQEQFVARLKAQYPLAQIELQTQAWGGRNTNSYLNEPKGSPHNYQETVLALKPDLVISEFVNDANLKPTQVEERYTKLEADFKAVGAEWIILTPHYVRPDWMNLTRERDIDNDPRPYVEGLRQFAAKHDVALADASLRYGRLWRHGIPYNTLMLNVINHPNPFGLRLFADALMALFR